MRKKRFLLFMILILLLPACSKPTYERSGINIFNNEGNILMDFIPESPTLVSSLTGDDKRFIIINNDGKMIKEEDDFDLKIDGAAIVAKRGNTLIAEDVISIYSGEDISRIGKLYQDMNNFLKEDKKVLAILLDGFSYEQFSRLREDGRIPFLSSIFKEKAISVYMPVTNSGFASIITGALPEDNGVYNRNFRDIKVKSIFKDALEMNKKAVLLEGDIKILNTEIEPMLHVDLNKDEDVDDEIYESAISYMDKDMDLIFIHFHGIDDRGHSYGPYAHETLAYIEKIDSYLQNLDDLWDGVILATADHGMNEKDGAGDHGDGTYEDMIVPYFLKEN